MEKTLRQSVIDAANEVAQWKMRAYIAEAKLNAYESEVEANEEDIVGELDE